jgi:poly(3-hydroxybutyrate) depolymerase
MRFAEFTAPAARHPLLADVAHFGPNPGNLRMQLYVPAGPGPKPLVVTLHGCGQTAEGYA